MSSLIAHGACCGSSLPPTLVLGQFEGGSPWQFSIILLAGHANHSKSTSKVLSLRQWLSSPLCSTSGSQTIMADHSAPHPTPPESPTTDSTPDFLSTHFLGPRPRRQFSLFLFGATCVGLSILSTRRALVRRYVATVPHFYQQSNALPREPISLQKEAAEALQIATINVLSFATLMTGGTLWAFDVSGIGELRERIRKMKKQREVKGGTNMEQDKAVEREFEDFLGPSLRKGPRKGETRETEKPQ